MKFSYNSWSCRFGYSYDGNVNGFFLNFTLNFTLTKNSYHQVVLWIKCIHCCFFLFRYGNEWKSGISYYCLTPNTPPMLVSVFVRLRWWTFSHPRVRQTCRHSNTCRCHTSAQLSLRSLSVVALYCNLYGGEKIQAISAFVVLICYYFKHSSEINMEYSVYKYFFWKYTRRFRCRFSRFF